VIRTGALSAVQITLVGIATIAWLAPHLMITNHCSLIAAALSPYLLFAAPIALAVAVARVTDRWFPTLAVLGVTVLSLAAQLPIRHDRSDISAHGPELRIITANLSLGQADAGALVNTARARADVVAVQELTPDATARLAAAGMTRAFPYHFALPRPDGSGAGLWSRYRISELRLAPQFEMISMRARIELPGTGSKLRIIVAHLPGPWPQSIDNWRRDFELISQTIRSLANEPDPGAIVVAADFNATIDMQPFRRLLSHGFTDAASDTHETIRTYPQDSIIPPLLGIDHILLKNCTASEARSIPLPGSDHLALLVDTNIPKLS
jgi:endonuclease/exonuclease/phosphatase (EEP) superfamily protein YafD